jgi:hypothetical protein
MGMCFVGLELLLCQVNGSHGMIPLGLAFWVDGMGCVRAGFLW